MGTIRAGIKVFCDQSNLFSIRLVTIYDLVIILFQLFGGTFIPGISVQAVSYQKT